jgi:multidrug resistance protein
MRKDGVVSRSGSLVIIFFIILIDLIGFGIVIPLVGLYGKYYGASGWQLSLLGGIYSLMQFFFSPFWGSLSDRIGRRPVLLVSLAGSTLSYLIFGLTSQVSWLLISRALGGLFAANVSAAQAYIADSTSASERTRGMGFIGAAFGIGFILGPPLGGLTSAHGGLHAPGLLAASICGVNFFFALFQLPESLPLHLRTKKRGAFWGRLKDIRAIFHKQRLKLLLAVFFWFTFSFSAMEQTFSLFFQKKFSLPVQQASYRTSLILMTAGIVGALIQGGLLRRLVRRYQEIHLLIAGMLIYTVSMMLFPYGQVPEHYFLLMVLVSTGSALIHPVLSSLISQKADASEQGMTLGVSSSLGSLARAVGPFLGLASFSLFAPLPYWISSFIAAMSFLSILWFSKTQQADRSISS